MVEVNSFARLSPAFGFFIFLNVLGVAITAHSGGLLGVYIGLECSLLGMVGILVGESAEENEGCMKYFIFQALGSIYLLMGFILIIEPVVPLMGAFWIVIVGVCLKAGFFPFHYWVPSVVVRVSWFSCFIIMVWQKIGLMCFLAKWSISYELVRIVEVLAVLTAIFGGIGGIGVVFYKATLAYSSLVHGGWLLVAALIGVGCVLYYIVIYGLIVGSLMYRLYTTKVSSFEDFSNAPYHGSHGLFAIFADLMSLAGVPVLPGFLAKFMVLVMAGPSYPLTVYFLILSSMLSLYYYMKIAVVASVGAGVNHYLTHKWGKLKLLWKIKMYLLLNFLFYAGGLMALMTFVAVVQ
uniref:NADH dehydrogenase subunit 2 n=1 Tax=Nototeredo knoxi TaxID=2939324 RepID=UPI002028DD6F|nr:NADH dehydrogenase subunit 2 [Nototeredo knoxi]UPX89282.1 NADH dehydrogenase subunit 2 [Nototeredo knoxi]